MNVWKSDEKLLIFASLISPSKIILSEQKYQAFNTVFHHQMKHLNSLLSVSSGDETLHLILDTVMLHQHIWTVQIPFSIASSA